MKRGRKAKPTAQKAAAGNPGKRKLNRAEPKAPLGLILPKGELGEQGVAVWSEALALGQTWLTPADAFLLTRWCDGIAHLIVQGPLESMPATLSGENGEYTNPAVRCWLQVAQRLEVMGNKLGFDPSSRAGLTGKRPEDAERDAEEAALQPLRVIKGGKA